MPKELIFTSVPTGINPGSTGYCTVAKHKDIDRLLERELETISFYELMDVEYKPVVHAYRVLRINTGTFYVLSRISFSGSDHTGRTNYLAHNLIFDESEVMSMQASPADFFLDGKGWLSSWPTDRSPIFYNPGQGEKSLFLNPFLRNDLAQPTWTALTGRPHSACELFYYGQLKFLTIGGDYKKMLGLLSEFSLVANEARKQWVWEHFTFTSYLQSSDRVSDFKIVAGTDGNENLAQLNWDTFNLFSASPTSIFKASNTDIFSELPIQHKQPEPQESALRGQSVGESASGPVENTVSVSPNINSDTTPVDSSPSVQVVENNLTTKYLKPQSSIAPKGLDIPPPTKSSKIVWYLIGFTFLILAGLTGYLFFPMENEEIEQDTIIVQKEIHERDSSSEEEIDIPPPTTSEEEEESNQSVAIPEEKITQNNVTKEKQEPLPSEVSPSPVGDTIIPDEQIFEIPPNWKEAKITIHEPIILGIPEGCNKKYFWNGRSCELSDSDILNMKGGLFWVKEKKENPFSSTISEVHIHPYSKTNIKICIQGSSSNFLNSNVLISASASQLQKKIKELSVFLTDTSFKNLTELKEKIRSDSQLELNFEHKDEKLQVTVKEIQNVSGVINKFRKDFNSGKEKIDYEALKKGFSEEIKKFSLKENDFESDKVFDKRCREEIKKIFQEDLKKIPTLLNLVIVGSLDDEKGLFINTKLEEFRNNLLSNRDYIKEKKQFDDIKKKLKNLNDHIKGKKGKPSDDQIKQKKNYENLVDKSKYRLSITEKQVDEIIKKADGKLKEFKSLYEKKNELKIRQNKFLENTKKNIIFTKMESILVSLRDALFAFEKSDRGYPWTIMEGNGETILEVVK